MDKFLKSQLRLSYLKMLKQLTKNDKTQWNREICQKFIKSKYFTQNQVFAIYASLPHEVDTYELIKILLAHNKKVCCPRITGEQINFYYISNLQQLVIDNKFNIPEPRDNCEPVDVLDIEIAVVPVIGYDDKNNRLGYGGGFYDRFLNDKKFITSIGLAYKTQLISDKNYLADAWDIVLNAIITNN